MVTVDRDVVFALLEDGPHSLDELAAWLEVPSAALAPALDAIGIKTCELCQRRFIRGKATSGRFCTRRCYAPSPGPSHQKKAVEIPQTRGKTDTSTARLGENGARLYPKNTIDVLLEEDEDEGLITDVEDAPADIDEDLDELEAPAPARRGPKPKAKAALRQPVRMLS